MQIIKTNVISAHIDSTLYKHVCTVSLLILTGYLRSCLPPDVGNVAEKHLICQEQKWRNGIASSCWMMP